MTKSKRNFIFMALLLAVVMVICSAFVAQTSTKTVEATETTDTRSPGLYETGTSTLIKSWDTLTSDGTITITPNIKLEVTDKTIAGDLICGKVSNVVILTSAFKDCTQLTYLDISQLGGSHVMSMDSAFENCTSLTAINLDNFGATNTLSDMHDAFKGCTSLESIDFSSFSSSTSNTRRLSAVAEMFEGCTSLKTANLSNLIIISGDTSTNNNILTMSRMFYNCSSLETLNLSGCNFTNCTKAANAEDMFTGCSSLKTIIYPAVGSQYVSLPGNNGWVATSNKSATPATTLDGFEAGATLVVAGAEEVPSTGVVANVTMTAIAFVSVAGLAFVATKKKKLNNFSN